MMFEDAEHEFQGTQSVLNRVQGEAESAKKEVAEWKERYAQLLLDKKTRATMGEAALILLLIIGVRCEHEAVDRSVAAIEGAMFRQLSFKSGT
ncbi:hypothetical protein BTUL_0076g00300 [Botrytis tulipae]|uniref:Uncharacterized protein n=1 Tax=Botrytis tulipae TaxID=87230 RepID=A0A4Z1END2_9HELO|nr:hypothetical protein BTUL_0076g00300 [Botrytis tulipae]